MEPSILARNIRALRAYLGDKQSTFAERIGVQQSYVSKWENRGIQPETRPLSKMAQLAGVSVEAFIDQPWTPPTVTAEPDIPATVKSEDGSIGLRHVDMSLAMGDGTNIDDFFEEGVFEFDAALLRTISRAPAHRLVVGHGIGDSMMPTIHDDALVIFDTTQTVLNSDDRIWAISLYGAGSIKRLQVIGRDRVLVVSDNPTVPNKEVLKEDLRILGRVIWSARKH